MQLYYSYNHIPSLNAIAVQNNILREKQKKISGPMHKGSSEIYLCIQEQD